MNIERFCANELDEREYLRKPWAHKGWLYASNGHILVRVPSPENQDALSAHKIAESAVGMFAAFPETVHGPLPTFQLGDKCYGCKGLGYYYAVKCDECDDGEFVHRSHTYACQECDGDGHIEVAMGEGGKKMPCRACHGRGYSSKRVAVGLGGGGFDAAYLGWIRALPKPTIAARGPEDSAHFVFVGGEGLLMPMRP